MKKNKTEREKKQGKEKERRWEDGLDGPVTG